MVFIEVYPGLFVGDQDEFEDRAAEMLPEGSGWFVIHACKEPYHRDLLGYKSRGAPKNSPEYLFAIRENRMYLNMVDADDPAYIPQKLVDAVLDRIHLQLQKGEKVFIHCNQGHSRAPGLAFLYLIAHTNEFGILPYTSMYVKFLEKYPEYCPSNGIDKYLEKYWAVYRCRYPADLAEDVVEQLESDIMDLGFYTLISGDFAFRITTLDEGAAYEIHFWYMHLFIVVMMTPCAAIEGFDILRPEEYLKQYWS